MTLVGHKHVWSLEDGMSMSNHFTCFHFLLICHFRFILIWVSMSSFSPWSLPSCTSLSSAGVQGHQSHNFCSGMEWLPSILMVPVIVIRIVLSVLAQCRITLPSQLCSLAWSCSLLWPMKCELKFSIKHCKL